MDRKNNRVQPYLKSLKRELREEFLRKRQEISPDAKADAQEHMRKIFSSMISFRYSDTILMYSSINGELDLSVIAKEARAKGKRVAYPRCEEDSIMNFYYVESEDDLVRGKFGIKEPAEHCQLYNPSGRTMDVCIIPGLAFDKYGYRIGYGKGYYDRYLSRFEGVKAGFVMTDFFCDRLPHGKYDLKADIIVTEKGVRVPIEG